MCKRFAFVAAALAVFLVSGTAQLAKAVPITFEYRNTADATFFGGGADDDFRLRYTFDSGATDIDPTSRQGEYYPVSGFLRWGSISTSLDSFAARLIVVTIETTFDSYDLVFASGLATLGTEPINIFIFTLHGSDMGFASDALPLTPDFAEAATSVGLFIGPVNHPNAIAPEFTGKGSLRRVDIAEPGTLSLLIAGLPFLRRRKRKART